MMHTTAIGSESIDSAFVRELFRESFGPNTDKRGLPKGGSLDELFNSHELCMMGHPLVGIRTSAAADSARVFNIWREAVDATHHFLTPTDRQDIEAEVAAFLPQVPQGLAVDDNDSALGFMLLDDGRMEALFVHPEHRGVGIGRKLVRHALTLSSAITTDVNEQNLQAVGFYMHLGFENVGYSPLDQQGRPYPLIHLRIRSDPESSR
jgi:putative acetyltransferase